MARAQLDEPYVWPEPAQCPSGSTGRGDLKAIDPHLNGPRVGQGKGSRQGSKVARPQGKGKAVSKAARQQARARAAGKGSPHRGGT